jgi:hypothetical protein
MYSVLEKVYNPVQYGEKVLPGPPCFVLYEFFSSATEGLNRNEPSPSVTSMRGTFAGFLHITASDRSKAVLSTLKQQEIFPSGNIYAGSLTRAFLLQSI